jgi:hypothetical protein
MPREPREPRERAEMETRRRRMAAAAMFINIVVGITTTIASFVVATSPIPYHTSILTGEMWVQELLAGHPDRIKTELGMRLPVFLAFCTALRVSGLSDSRHLTVHEQAAIFLYMSVTGLNLRHVGERFQHSNETISQYVHICTSFRRCTDCS